MKKIVSGALGVAVISLMVSCGDNSQRDSKEIAQDVNEAVFENTWLENDAEFAVDAESFNLLEIRLGELAQTNASSPQVRDLARTIADNHRKASEELKSLASGKNITLPVALSEGQQKKYDDLASKKGSDFDKAYLDFVIKEHQDDLDDYRKELNNAADQDIRVWITNQTPVLQQHLQLAEATRESLK